MKRRGFTLALAAGTLGSCHRFRPQPLRLRVLTYNLRYITTGDKGWKAWTSRRDHAADLIRSDRPDLIGVQEAFRAMLDDLAERVAGFHELGVGREDGAEKGEYSAILVRRDRFEIEESGTFWLSDTPEVPNSKTWGNTVTRVCTWARLFDMSSRRRLHFFNTHLDHESQPAREKGAALILERMAAIRPVTPLLLTGDFNADEDNPVIAALKAGPPALVDAWRAANPDTPRADAGTVHGFSGRRDTARIDYVFVPPEARIVDAEILRHGRWGIHPSDHCPVRATLEFSG